MRAVFLAAALLLAAAGAAAAETITVGSVGSASTNLWPSYIGITEGFFAAEGIDIDLIFVQSSAGVPRQVAAGAIDLSAASGLAEPNPWLFVKGADYYRDPDGPPDLAALQANIGTQREPGFLKADMDVAAYADLTVVQEAAKRLN